VFAVRVTGLKHIAERFGQDYADRVLVHLGTRLQDAEADVNCATLLDKQDFAMIVADFRASSLGWSDAAAQIEQLAQRDRDAALDMLADALQRLVGRPLRLEGYEFNAPVRVGWALAQGEPANAQDLLDRALDAAGAVPAADTAPQEDENK
jgi:GGDEF domain-containing protein